MSETEVKVKKKTVGNKTTEVIVGSAAAKLNSAYKSLKDALTEADKLEDKVQESTLKLTDLEQKISETALELNNRIAQNKVELELAYKADKRVLAEQYLSENSLISVSKEEYDNLETKYSNLRADFDKELNAAVGKQKGILNSDYDNKVKMNELEYKAKEAGNMAALQQKDTEINSLKEQIRSLEKMIEANRNAEVERAKASSIGTLNVGTGNGR